MVQCSVLISPECFQVNSRGIARHGGELLPGDEPAPLSQRDQLCDSVAVPGDGEGLAVLHSIHDLSQPGPQIALGNLRVGIHKTMVALSAIRCHKARVDSSLPTAPGQEFFEAFEAVGSAALEQARVGGQLTPGTLRARAALAAAQA